MIVYGNRPLVDVPTTEALCETEGLFPTLDIADTTSALGIGGAELGEAFAELVSEGALLALSDGRFGLFPLLRSPCLLLIGGALRGMLLRRVSVYGSIVEPFQTMEAIEATIRDNGSVVIESRYERIAAAAARMEGASLRTVGLARVLDVLRLASDHPKRTDQLRAALKLRMPGRSRHRSAFR